ncbi:hypothetical protein J132_02338 [Termitomyces sp. J132]|nr:hypothetical protein J132_02338 [Termitomyces sp. J132]
MKTKSITGHISEDSRIEQHILDNPLVMMPPLNPNLPPFIPTQQSTSEWQAKLIRDHNTGFLTSNKINILVNVVTKQEKAFALEDSEQGSLCPNFFLPVCIPTIPHVPWIQHNCPIPPGLEKEVCEIICDKTKAGMYEPLNSAYHSCWFCVLKKNGKLRIVHSIEPLNCVTICHSGVPPFPDHVAESFAGCICSTTLDLLVDTSYIAVSFYLCQCTSNNCKECCYNCFSSITLNDRESLSASSFMDVPHGIRNLIIEIDTCYIKGMLYNPDIQPSASMNCWIMWNLTMFHFELVHIKGTYYGPDSLLQCLLQPSNPIPDDSDNSVYEDWIDWLHGFIYQVQLPLLLLHQVDQFRWSTATYSVSWSECIMIHKQMGCSPYYAMTSTHPLLPADIVEVTYLQLLPNSFLLSTDLIAHQAIDLQHCQEDLK